MSPLTSVQKKLLEFLIEYARNSPGETLTYGDVSRSLGEDFNPRDRHHAKLINNLAAVVKYCHEHEMPLFTAVVVRASDGLPGGGFFQFARSVGALDSEDPADERTYWRNEIARTIEYARNAEPAAAGAAEDPTITVHILQVNDDPANLDELESSVRAGQTVEDWQMPKGARPGDAAVWYASGRNAGRYVAWGWINGVPYPVQNGHGPYRGTVGSMRELPKRATRQDVIDHCGVNGGVQSIQTLTGDRALDFLEAVGLGLVTETVRMLAKAARRRRAAQ